MPSSDDRFYLMQLRERHAMWGDIGSLIKIEGLIIGGGGTQAQVYLPGFMPKDERTGAVRVEPTIQEWCDFIRQSDNPEILVGEMIDGKAPITKIFHRKVRYEISGAVQQKIWARDQFRCWYCGTLMGKVLLTIDHLMPLELGGANDVTNYLTACRPCNKDKANEHPTTWMARRCGAKLENALAWIKGNPIS